MQFRSRGLRAQNLADTQERRDLAGVFVGVRPRLLATAAELRIPGEVALMRPVVLARDLKPDTCDLRDRYQ